MTPLALVGLKAASGVVGSILGNSSNDPHKTAQLTQAQKDEFEQYFSHNISQKKSTDTSSSSGDPINLIGKTVTVQDDQGQSVTGKVQWVDARSDGYTMKIDGKNYSNSQLKSVEGVSV